jgi:hypothetical protein
MASINTMKLVFHLNLVPRLRIFGAVILLLHTSSSGAEGKVFTLIF